ncbi:MAG: peptidase C1 [Anaerolineaceae bacterium]|nr:peptidase C1 [Anaerolineaceae bacterium]
MSEDELPGLERAISERGFNWRAGTTTLSALPQEEQDRRLGLRLIPEEMQRLSRERAMLQPRAASFPPAWDWRNVDGADWITAIRDQKGCGSCVSFAAVAVLEAMLKRHHADASLQPDLSEAHLFFCGCGNCCNSGWWPTYALDYAKNQGVPTEGCFPYQDHDMPCSSSCGDWQGQALKVTEWQEIFDHGARKEWLANTGPMIGCMAVYRDFFNYRGGVYRHTSGDLAGYHAICVVGYSEAEQAWICKNSWGPGWGDAGWFRIGYGECDIDAQFPMYGVAGVVPGGEPGPGPEPGPEPVPGCNIVARIVRALVR